MANLPLTFAEVLGGAIVLMAGLAGDSIGNVMAGKVSLNNLNPFAGGSSSTPASSSTGTGTSSRTGAMSAVANGVGGLFHVKASQESDGGSGACGAIGSGGLWYSELSDPPSSLNFSALGHIPCGTPLKITNPANGKSVIARKRDVGAGSSFGPDMGLYPATVSALGLSPSGEYNVQIQAVGNTTLKPSTQ